MTRDFDTCFDAKTAALYDTLQKWGCDPVKETTASRVNYSGILYTVKHSGSAPNLDGDGWRQLLQEYDIGGYGCVSGPGMSASGGPASFIGSHVTPFSGREVHCGGYCYLIPLHAELARTSGDMARSHSHTEMLELYGFCDDVLSATFMARMKSSDPYSLIYSDGEDWKSCTLNESDRNELRSCVERNTLPVDVKHFVILKREQSDTGTYYKVSEVQLNGLSPVPGAN